jgi:hypothetical protein
MTDAPIRPSPDSLPKSYHVIFEDADTRIHECDDDKAEYETFEEAKKAALDYLEDLINGCQERFDELKQARTYEEYARS